MKDEKDPFKYKILDAKQIPYESTYDELSNEHYAKIKEVLIDETPAFPAGFPGVRNGRGQ